MNIRDVLYMRNTWKLRPRASIQDKFLARKLGGSGVITTATGNPLSIVTNKAQNALDLQIAFSPRQSGSGTPSPDNIRPIVPWTEITLTKNGTDTSYALGGSYYGGSLDVVTGELTVDTMYLSYKWSEFGTKASLGNYTRGQIVLPSDAVYPPTAGKPQMCNIAPYKASFAEDSLHFYCNPNRFSVFVPNDTDGDTIITAVYELATPITVSLTPSEVALLAGNNTLATDGDNITVTYMAKK